ncbi:MAG: sigma-70 domain-containing protein [Lachnospiraceae bacterium]|nr:sigma-70 domain-containing protein [Lachnospiraceae bacterium]
MKNKEEFQVKFQSFLALVQEKKGVMSREEAEAFFAEDDLNESQLNMVMDYLASVKPVEDKFTEEEQSYLADYMEMLTQLKPERDGEMADCVRGVLQQDPQARERLVELHLSKVVDIAKVYHAPGLYIGDLIQEGNVGLTIGIGEIQDEECEMDLIEQAIHREIKNMLDEESDAKEKDKTMIAKVAALDESLTKLEKELGRKVYTDELAADMGITEEEVLDILRLAGEELDDTQESNK